MALDRDNNLNNDVRWSVDHAGNARLLRNTHIDDQRSTSAHTHGTISGRNNL